MTTHERIRQIFLQPHQAYRLSEAAELLEYSHEQIVAALDQGNLSLEGHGNIPRIPWDEIALAAAERWPQAVIEEALGRDAGTVMPELVQLVDLRARVPRFSVVVLARIAQREGTTVDQVLARQLLDLAVTESESIENSVSGLAAAVRWPVA